MTGSSGLNIIITYHRQIKTLFVKSQQALRAVKYLIGNPDQYRRKQVVFYVAKHIGFKIFSGLINCFRNLSPVFLSDLSFLDFAVSFRGR